MLLITKTVPRSHLVLEPPLERDPPEEYPPPLEREPPDEYPPERTALPPDERIELLLELRTADDELLVEELLLRTADDALLEGVLLLERVSVVFALRLGVVVTLVLLGLVAELRVVVTLLRAGVVALDRFVVLLLRVAVPALRVTVPAVPLTRLALPDAVRTALLPKVLSDTRLVLFTLVAVPRLLLVLSIASRTAVRRPCSNARAFTTPREALRLAKPRSG